MVRVAWIMQLMLNFFHMFSNIMIEVVDAIATIMCWLLHNLLEVLSSEHPCPIILHLLINVKVSADHSWSLWGNPFFNEVGKPEMEKSVS